MPGFLGTEKDTGDQGRQHTWCCSGECRGTSGTPMSFPDQLLEAEDPGAMAMAQGNTSVTLELISLGFSKSTHIQKLENSGEFNDSILRAWASCLPKVFLINKGI